MAQKQPRAPARAPVPAAAVSAAPGLRVVSLLASATDTVRALGCVQLLVGRTHECDWPEVQAVPAVTADKLGAMAPADADAAMTACSSALPMLGWGGGGGLALLDQALSPYRTDVAKLAELRPDVILTQLQGLGDDLTRAHFEEALRELLGHCPTVVHLAAADLGGVWADMRAIAEALKLGRKGADAVEGIRRRLEATAAAGRGRAQPRVAVVQWAEPLYAAGGWVPQLLRMCGAVDCLGRVQEAVAFAPQSLADARPDVIVFALCGIPLEQSRRMARECMQHVASSSAPAAAAIKRSRVVVVCGVRVFSRAGPLLVESAEVLVEALYGEAQPYGHEGKLWVCADADAGAVRGGGGGDLVGVRGGAAPVGAAAR